MKVYVKDMQVFTKIGETVSALFDTLKQGISAIAPVHNNFFDVQPFYANQLKDEQRKFLHSKYSQYSHYFIYQLALELINKCIPALPLPINDKDVIILLSSTKGNIQQLSQSTDDVCMYHLGEFVQNHFQLSYTPKVYSTACISGTQAIIQAQRMLQQNRYKYALVIGLDELTPFVYKGFSSFHAIEQDYCKPFDLERKGINLGEAGAAILLTNMPQNTLPVTISGGGMSNDANHLSGPSKTGEELAHAIKQALKEAKVSANDITLISAHGTATAYNDEMESKAYLNAQVNHALVYSLKSYMGHTLGTAGILETIVGVKLLMEQYQLCSLNFQQQGTPVALNISKDTKPYKHTSFLKTASGFGGCNAALVCTLDN